MLSRNLIEIISVNETTNHCTMHCQSSFCRVDEQMGRANTIHGQGAPTYGAAAAAQHLMLFNYFRPTRCMRFHSTTCTVSGGIFRSISRHGASENVLRCSEIAGCLDFGWCPGAPSRQVIRTKPSSFDGETVQRDVVVQATRITQPFERLQCIRITDYNGVVMRVQAGIKPLAERLGALQIGAVPCIDNFDMDEMPAHSNTPNSKASLDRQTVAALKQKPVVFIARLCWGTRCRCHARLDARLDGLRRLVGEAFGYSNCAPFWGDQQSSAPTRLAIIVRIGTGGLRT